VNIHNHTAFVPDVRFAQDEFGYECMALMLKATYAIPSTTQALLAADEQCGWVFEDQLATVFERPFTVHQADLPNPKPHVEYLVAGAIYSLDGKPADQLAAHIVIGNQEKKLRVRPPRHWELGLLGGKVVQAGNIVSAPIAAAIAFGGKDPVSENSWFEPNLDGTGYCESPYSAKANGLLLPQLEKFNQECHAPCTGYPFVTLGPVARNSLPRRQWAGTYSQEWLENRWPHLPRDFDERFLQCAQADQWLPELTGGEEVVLTGLTPHDSVWGASVRFQLPKFDFKASVHWRDEAAEVVTLRPDTITFEPDKGRFSVVSRVIVPLEVDIHSIDAVAFGNRNEREQLAPIVPTFVDLDDFIAQVRGETSPSQTSDTRKALAAQR
jgi:hypothetical protein